MKESPVSPVCSLWIVIEINLYTYLNLCMYIFIEFNSRITAQNRNRNRNSNSKLTTCHTKPFFVHESDSEYICIAMRVNQSVNHPTKQSIKLSQPKVSQISQLYIYIYISISISISVSISINQSAQYISSFTSFSRRILVVFFILSFSLSIYTI